MPFQEKNKPMTEMGADAISYAKFSGASEVRKETDSSRVGLTSEQTNAPTSDCDCHCKD